MDWLAAYVATLLIEVPAVLILMRAAGWTPRRADGGLSLPAAVAVAWLVNLTHPVLWWARPTEVGALLTAEVLVVVVEGLALALIGTRALWLRSWLVLLTGLLIALAANLASFAGGLVLYEVGWLRS